MAGLMQLSWLPPAGAVADTPGGAFVGDYISTSFSGGVAYPVFAVANAPSGGHLNEAMFTLG